jgi:hypothetical protein
VETGPRGDELVTAFKGYHNRLTVTIEVISIEFRNMSLPPLSRHHLP